MTPALIEISTPKGAPYEFLVVFAVLLLGPVLFRRAGIPGIIGLLVGGYAIGPHGLSLIGAGNNTLPDLGQLYLMFAAGVEIDLNLLMRYRRSAITFGLLTFILPFALGTLVGFALGWETLAALLLGSLLASHTLFSLSAAQAAATLAATVIGFQLGLFSSAVVNAVLVLILVSVLASTLAGTRASARAAMPDGPRPLGKRVVVGVLDPDHAFGALTIARRIARADGGVVHPLLVVPESAPFAPKPALQRLSEVVAAADVDGQVMTIVDRSVLHGALRVGRAQEATLVLVAEPGPEPAGEQPGAGDDAHGDAVAGRDGGRALRPVALAVSSERDEAPAPPVALVRGNATRLGAVRVRLDDEELAPDSLAAELARRVSSGAAQRLEQDHTDWAELLAPGDVTFVSSELGETLAKLPGAGKGLVVSTVAEWLIREESAGDEDAPDTPGDVRAV